ncbi:MAG: alpha/beta hydrolase [Phycisphaerales bacterium]|nr:MAG: alpha/beta hydrolase [Phycisphaerales bacterium]
MNTTGLQRVGRRRSFLRRVIVVTTVYSGVSAVAVFVAFLLGWATFARTLPDPSGWHTDAPGGEFTSRDAAPGYTLDDYLRQEARLFDALDALIDGVWREDAQRRFSRFNRASVSFPGSGFERNWNRTIVLEADAPRGGALLVHGLSDSPYSLRAQAESLHARGWTVVALRVPGHGTSPAALVEASRHDWAAAVRIGVAGVRERIPDGAPLALFGFSNGGALCVDYTLDAMDDPSLAMPDALVLYSPMIGITPFAKITRLHHLIAWIPAFEKVRWSRIEEEIDPYKYASWPTGASEQAFLVTRRLASRLSALAARGGYERMPPVLTFQSVVDSTISVPGLMDVLYERLPRGPSELVLFDLNRTPFFEDLLQSDNEPFIRARLDNPLLPYRLTLVTHAERAAPGEGEAGMLARTRHGDALTDVALSLSWPPDVFSLSHGAVPISVHDPILGVREATTAFPGPSLGSIMVRGEHGVLRVSEGLTMRLRHNPFYDYVEAKTDSWLREVIESSRP